MRGRPLCLICIILMAAVWFCRAAGIPIFGEPRLSEEEAQAFAGGRRVICTGRVEDRQRNGETVRYTLRRAQVSADGRTVTVPRLFVSVKGQERPALPGAVLSAAGEIRPLEKAGNEGQFDAASFYACQGIYYRVFSDEVREVRQGRGLPAVLLLCRERMEAVFAANMEEGQAGVLTAMLLGDRTLLTPESRSSYQTGGCLHLLVISGLHVTLLGTALFGGLQRLRMPLKGAGAVTAGAMILYTLLVGAPAAAVRACIMFLVRLFARMGKRSYDTASAMALAAILLLLRHPGCLFHAGFQLSFTAAAGASLVYPMLWKRWKKKPDSGPKGRRPVRRLLYRQAEASVSWLAIQICTLPLLCFYYYEIPLWSLPVNLLLVPWAGALLLLGLAGGAAGLLFPSAARWTLLPVRVGLGASGALLDAVRAVPGNTWICGKPAFWQAAVYCGCLLLFLFLTGGRRERRPGPADPHGRPRARARAAAFLLPAAGLFFLLYRTVPEFSLTMLDVGQGDCIVLRQGRTVFLSDGGSTGTERVGEYRIVPWLKSRGIRDIEGVFLSHDDADHINGIEELLVMIAERRTALRIGRVFLPGWMEETETGQRIAAECRAAGAETVWLARGGRVRAGALQIDAEHPFREDGAQSGNAGSLVLRVSYEGFTALLTGDLEGEGEEELLPYLSDTDCLKVAHHGSRWSTSKEFLEAADPEIALISAPERSMYGHPHRETLERLEEAGAAVFITKDCGAVELEAENGRVTVRCFRQGIS